MKPVKERAAAISINTLLSISSTYCFPMNMKNLFLLRSVIISGIIVCVASEVLVIPFNAHHNLTLGPNSLLPSRKMSHHNRLRLVPDATVPYFSELTNHCRALLGNFSSTVSTYLKCMTYYSKPAKLCQTCQYKLTEVERAYSDIKDDKTEPVCSKLLLSSDSLHMIEREYQHAQYVWQMADCNYCYDNPDVVNGRWHLSNKTKDFFELFNITINCFAMYLPVNQTNATKGNPAICSNCSRVYSLLDEMFLTTFQFNDKICTDIFEAMNYTRIVWSRQYNCYIRNRNLSEMIPIITLLLMLPLLFYPGIKISVDIYDRKQKKKEELLENSGDSNEYDINNY